MKIRNPGFLLYFPCSLDWLNSAQSLTRASLQPDQLVSTPSTAFDAFSPRLELQRFEACNNDNGIMLLDKVLQPSILSLFSSTSSHPTLLAHLTVPPSAPESFISLLQDSDNSRETILAWGGASSADLEVRVTSLEAQQGHRGQVGAGEEQNRPARKHLRGQVLHVQAPDCRTTSIRWGSWKENSWKETGLGTELPVLHLQVKDLGQMWYVDVGVLDDAGEITVLRASNWQPHAQLHPATTSFPRLLHLPLSFPSTTNQTTPFLTHWTTLSLPLSQLLSSLPAASAPAPRFKAVLGVEVHATCRLRRVWFSEEGVPGDMSEEEVRKGRMQEMAMYAAADE
ncbi:hypothetical protein JCM11641_006075 [Rhodosporidiobolus odoratus]